MSTLLQIHDDFVAVQPDPDHFDHCGCCDIGWGGGLCKRMACTSGDRVDKREVFWVYRQAAATLDLEREDEVKNQLEDERIERE